MIISDLASGFFVWFPSINPDVQEPIRYCRPGWDGFEEFQRSA